MRIIINHLTRMQPGYFCAAGLECESQRHIRPVLHTQLPVELLARCGGPFQLGTVLDLGPTRFAGHVPEIEDRLFDRDRVRREVDVDPREFWRLNAAVARPSLAQVFGIPLPRVGATCAVPENQGLYSLGCYWAAGGRLLTSREGDRERLRFRLLDDGHELRVPVTDIRLYHEDHRTVDSAAARKFTTAIERMDRVLVSIGLSRPFRKSEDQLPMHWLQVNNIHLPPESPDHSPAAIPPS